MQQPKTGSGSGISISICFIWLIYQQFQREILRSIRFQDLDSLERCQRHAHNADLQIGIQSNYFT